MVEKIKPRSELTLSIAVRIMTRFSMLESAPDQTLNGHVGRSLVTFYGGRTYRYLLSTEVLTHAATLRRYYLGIVSVLVFLCAWDNGARQQTALHSTYRGDDHRKCYIELSDCVFDLL